MKPVQPENFPHKSFSHFTARKAALEQFTRCRSPERVADGVRIEAVPPEQADSSLIVSRIGLGATQAGTLNAQQRSRICPGRRAMPDDVAHWIASLASPSAATVTGPNPVVDSGEDRMRADERLWPVPIRDSIGMETDADFVSVEFGDFKCPKCKQAAPAFLLFGNRVDRRITVVFRHFPLSDVQTISLTTLEACESAGGSREFCVCELSGCLERRQRNSGSATEPTNSLEVAGCNGLDEAVVPPFLEKPTPCRPRIKFGI